MLEKMNMITEDTARKLVRLLESREAARDIAKAGQHSAARWVLVRCDSATAVATTGLATQFYPATIIQTAADIIYPPGIALSNTIHIGTSVLLTLIGDDVTKATPVEGKTYVGVLTGDVTLDASGSLLGRPRVVGPYLAQEAAPSSWKLPVRVASTTNASIGTAYANGQVVDGVTLVTGDRILLKDQGGGADNGILTVNATGAPTRAVDANSAALLYGAVVVVKEGTTNHDRLYQQTADTVSLGITANTWERVNLPQSGDVFGPSSSTDNAVARFDLVSGKLIQNSSVTIDDSGVVKAPVYTFPNIGGFPQIYLTSPGFGNPFSQAVLELRRDSGAMGTLYLSSIYTLDNAGSPFWAAPADGGITANGELRGLGVDCGTGVYKRFGVSGDSGAIGPGAACTGGIIYDKGSGTWLVDPGDGLAAGSYP